MQRHISTFLVLLITLSSTLAVAAAYSAENQFPRLASKESEIISRVNGTNFWNYDLQLEKIAMNHSNSNYAFRSSGSVGANETAQWIKEQFENFGLETTMEPFEFITWNLPNQPSLVIFDGNGTAGNRTVIGSFQSTHYSWPTPEAGVLKDLIILPLPENLSRTQVFDQRFYDVNAWNALNTTDKILLIGYELRWNAIWHQAFWNKLKAQPPAAIIYTYWYPWMASTPMSFTSVGGLPLGDRGPYYWQLKIPVGWVSYEDGLLIRKKERNINVSANFTIPAVIGTGPHYNVVGKLKGSGNAEKSVIISGHYDTVMASGFCDNGAGTSGVLELARVFANAAKTGYSHDYTLVFIAFAGEELGLAGSINYMKQHEEEMANVVAVINLDSIGSDVLQVTETFPNDGGLDLDEVILRAADDLGVKAELEEAGASDEMTFRNPKAAVPFYDKAWGLDAAMDDVTRVKASATIMSFPLFTSDQWENKTSAIGWIHTSYDNSTSTARLNWVEFDDFEQQIQVAALSIMRVTSSAGSSALSQILIAALLILGVMGALAYFKSSLVRAKLEKMYDGFANYVEMKELMLAIILTGLFFFVSIVSYSRMGRIEVLVREIPTPVTMRYLGRPFEIIALEQSSQGLPSSAEGGAPMESLASHVVGTQIFWNGLFLDVLLYFISALLLVYVIARFTKK